MAELTVRMPALSATMEDALLVEWLVAVGDEVRSGQAIAEVGTDKVDMELESPYDGTISALLVDPDTRVGLGQPVATVASEEDDLLGDLDLGDTAVVEEAAPAEDEGSEQAPATEARPEAEPSAAAGPESTSQRDGETTDDRESGAQPSRGRGIVPALPPVRYQARRLEVDLAEVEATGSRGQVTRADLARHVEARTQASPDEGAGQDQSQPSAVRATSNGATDAARRDRRTKTIRRAAARTLTRSAAIPQFTLHRRIDAQRLQSSRGGRSVVTELARALAAALWRHPDVNAVWDDDAEETVALPGVRIGVAVDTQDGLLVAGVDDPDADAPDQADKRLRAAISRVRSGNVEIRDGEALSSTISNLGGFGVDRFNALLLPPQATILSVGRIVETPVVVDGRLRARPMLDVGLTADHRVVDGAAAARLLETFASRLEA